MESIKVETQKSSQEIQDPDPMYFEFIAKQDQSNWEYEESLDTRFAPNEVIAEFIQEYLRIHNFRHQEIYKYCNKHPGSFTSMLRNYYKSIIEGREMSDVIKHAFQMSEEELINLRKAEKNKQEIAKKEEIKAREKLIHFPEHLIEETGGVEGYVRKELTWEDLEHLYSNFFSKEELKKWVDIFWKLSDYESYSRDHEKDYRSFEKIDSLKSFEILFSILQDLNGFFDKRHFINEKINNFKEHLTPAEFEKFEKNIPRALNLFRRILDNLGDNFISRENIHVMNGAWGLSSREAEEDFKKKMIVQKIFDPSDTSVRIDNGGSGQNVLYNVHSIVDPTKREFISASSIVPDSDRYKEGGMLKKESFLIFAGGGLSVSNGGIWAMDGRDDSRLSVSKVIFGFGSSNKAYIQYLIKYSKLLEDTGLFKKDDYKKQYLCSKDLISSGRSSVYSPFGDSPHPMIPVVIGHPDIPDLRWCHASHVYIPTKDGINILKMVSSKEEMKREEERFEAKNSNSQ